MDTTQTNQTSMRELDCRENDGIEVRMMWCSTNGRVSVAVNDTRTGHEFSVDVPDGTKTLDVFNHPFAYAA